MFLGTSTDALMLWVRVDYLLHGFLLRCSSLSTLDTSSGRGNTVVRYGGFYPIILGLGVGRWPVVCYITIIL